MNLLSYDTKTTIILDIEKTILMGSKWLYWKDVESVSTFFILPGVDVDVGLVGKWVEVRLESLAPTHGEPPVYGGFFKTIVEDYVPHPTNPEASIPAKRLELVWQHLPDPPECAGVIVI